MKKIVKYRSLEAGEIIRDGDQVDRCNNPWKDMPVWEPASNIGMCWVFGIRCWRTRYRRPIMENE